MVVNHARDLGIPNFDCEVLRSAQDDKRGDILRDPTVKMPAPLPSAQPRSSTFAQLRRAKPRKLSRLQPLFTVHRSRITIPLTAASGADAEWGAVSESLSA